MERCHEMPSEKEEQHIRDHKFRSRRKLDPEVTRRNVSHPTQESSESEGDAKSPHQ